MFDKQIIATEDLPLGFSPDDVPLYIKDVARITRRHRSTVFKAMKTGALKGYQSGPRAEMTTNARHVKEWLYGNPVE